MHKFRWKTDSHGGGNQLSGFFRHVILVAPSGFEEFHDWQKQWFMEMMTLDSVVKKAVGEIQTNLAYNFCNLPDDAEFIFTNRIAMRSIDDFEHS